MAKHPLTDRITRWDAHHRFIAALIVALAVFASLGSDRALLTQLIMAWVAYVLVLLILSWNTMYRADTAHIRNMAARQDAGRTVIFVLVLAGACVSLLAIGWLLGGAKQLPRDRLTAHVILSVISILSSWLLIHTTFAFRYAHRFYAQDRQGLHFPDEAEPDYMDFGYFAFVIGMTSQVSDVTVSSPSMRRLVLVHSVLSFIFNTLILALSINILSSMI